MWNTKLNRHRVELQGTSWTRDVKMWIPGSAVRPFQMILHFSSEKKKILNGSKIKSKFLHCDKRGFCPWPWGLQDISLALLCLCVSPLRQWVCGPKEICPPGNYVYLWDHAQGVWDLGLSTSDSNGPESLSKDSTVLYLHWSYMRPLPTPWKSLPQMLFFYGVCWFFSAGIPSQLSYFLICQSEWIASTTYVLYLCIVLWLLRV